jgi:hypothetical protein
MPAEFACDGLLKKEETRNSIKLCTQNTAQPFFSCLRRTTTLPAGVFSRISGLCALDEKIRSGDVTLLCNDAHATPR